MSKSANEIIAELKQDQGIQLMLRSMPDLNWAQTQMLLNALVIAYAAGEINAANDMLKEFRSGTKRSDT